MIAVKTGIYTLLLFVSCTFSNAQQIDSGFSTSPIHLKVNDTSLVDVNDEKIVFQDSVSTTSLPPFLVLPKSDSISMDYPPKTRDFRRLGYDSTLYIGAAVVTFGLLWVMPESFTHWDKQAMKEKGMFYKWKENVKAGPVWDGDSFTMNYVAHPYCGGVYYMTARSSGFTVLESFTYSAIMSTFFWEYGIEAFAEIPSVQDLIFTPVLGSVFGEGLFYAKKSIIKHDKKVMNSRFLGITTLFLIDPFNTILDGLGYKERVKAQLVLAPVSFDPSSNTAVWGVTFTAGF